MKRRLRHFFGIISTLGTLGESRANEYGKLRVRIIEGPEKQRFRLGS